MDETGWLIETLDTISCKNIVYLGIVKEPKESGGNPMGEFGWVTIEQNPIRFAREEDALNCRLALIDTLNYGQSNKKVKSMVLSSKVNEHKWSRYQKCDVIGCKLEAIALIGWGIPQPSCGFHARLSDHIVPIYPEVTDLDMESSGWERRKFKRPFSPKTCPECGMFANEYYGSDEKWHMAWHVNFQGIPCSLVVGPGKQIMEIADPANLPAS